MGLPQREHDKEGPKERTQGKNPRKEPKERTQEDNPPKSPVRASKHGGNAHHYITHSSAQDPLSSLHLPGRIALSSFRIFVFASILSLLCFCAFVLFSFLLSTVFFWLSSILSPTFSLASLGLRFFFPLPPKLGHQLDAQFQTYEYSIYTTTHTTATPPAWSCIAVDDRGRKMCPAPSPPWTIARPLWTARVES